MKPLFANACAIAALSTLLFGCADLGGSDSSGMPSLRQTVEPGAPLTRDMEASLRQAQTQRQSGDLQGATQTLAQLVLVAPDDPRVVGEYGKVLVAQGRTDDAIAFLTRAIQLKQSDWTLYSAVGVAYDQKGDYRSAQVAYARALQLKPGDPTILSNAALSHLQQGDIPGAHALLVQAAKAGGTDPKIQKNLAFVESIQTAAPAHPVAAAAAHPQPVKPAATASAAPAHPQTASTAPAHAAASAAAPALKPSTAQSQTASASHAPAPAAKPAPAHEERTAQAAPTSLRHSQ